MSTVAGVTKVTYSDFFGNPHVTTLTNVEVLRFQDRDISLNPTVAVNLTTSADTYTAPDSRNYLIDGRAGNDSITTDAGNDQILGGAGNDTMTGGAGHDTFRFNRVNSGTDVVNGGAGYDRILAEVDNAVLRFTSFSGIEFIDASGVAPATLAGTSAANNFNLSGVELLNIAARIDMGGGNDTVTGSAGSDWIVGGAGNDRLIGGVGDDQFELGTGSGNDTIDGGAGTDTVFASQAGTKVYFPGLSNFEVITGFGDTKIVGSGAANRIDLTGLGISGISQIDGGNGNDTIIGSDTADTILGGAGADRLTGALGADTFVFTAAAQSAGAAVDFIMDFVQGTDRIDLSAIDANTILAVVEDFAFIGAAAFSGSAGELRYDSNTFAGETRVYGDTNGDGVAEMTIRLAGAHNFLATDFLV